MSSPPRLSPDLLNLPVSLRKIALTDYMRRGGRPVHPVCSASCPWPLHWHATACIMVHACKVVERKRVVTALQWESIEPVGASPDARHSHAAVVMDSAQGVRRVTVSTVVAYTCPSHHLLTVAAQADALRTRR